MGATTPRDGVTNRDGLSHRGHGKLLTPSMGLLVTVGHSVTVSMPANFWRHTRRTSDAFRQHRGSRPGTNEPASTVSAPEVREREFDGGRDGHH